MLASPLSKVSTGKTCNDSAIVMVNEEEEDEVKEKGVFKLGFQFRKLVKQLVEQQVCEWSCDISHD